MTASDPFYAAPTSVPTTTPAVTPEAPVPTAAPVTMTGSAAPAAPEADDLDGMRWTKLRALAASLGVDSTGQRDAIVARIRARRAQS